MVKRLFIYFLSWALICCPVFEANAATINAYQTFSGTWATGGAAAGQGLVRDVATRTMTAMLGPQDFMGPVGALIDAAILAKGIYDVVMPLVNGNPLDVPNQANSPIAQPAAPATQTQTVGAPYCGYDDNSKFNDCNGTKSDTNLQTLEQNILAGYCGGSATTCYSNNLPYLKLGSMPSATTQWVDAQCTTTKSCPWGYEGIGTINYSVVCPAGYSVSGSSCNLTDTTKAQFTSDGTCEVSVSSAGYAIDTRDPDCGSLATQLAKNPNQITSAGTDQYGNPIAHTMTHNPDGSQTYSQTIQNADSNGNTQTVTRSITYDNSGNVINNTYVTTPGGTLNVSNPTAPVTTGTAPGSPLAINFPSDYARQSQVDTTNQTLTATNGKLDTLHNDLTDTSAGESYNDPSGNTPSDDSIWNKLMAFTPSLDHVKNTTFAAGGVCPTWDADTFFGHLTMNAHCDILEQQRANASAVFTALWTVMATIIFLGA